MMAIKNYKLSELIDGLEVTLRGDPSSIITGISPIQQSCPGHITFLNNSLYRKYLPGTKAAAVILSESDLPLCPVNAIVTNNPYYVYAKIAAFFSDPPAIRAGIHPSAVINNATSIHPSAHIAANSTIGYGVVIGADVIIGPNVTIGDFAEVGEGTQIEANVSIYQRVKLGRRNRIASGAVIGSEGFGFAEQQKAWHRVPQLGTVVTGDDVDIGANTTIDRGALEDTIIETGVKLDNLIQIGHNVRIGAHTIIAGCVAVAGSADIGKHCMIGGATCIAGHISLCDHTIVTGMTAVSKSIREPGIYSSGIVGAVPNQEFRKNNARFHRLENLIERVKALELALRDIKARE